MPDFLSPRRVSTPNGTIVRSFLASSRRGLGRLVLVALRGFFQLTGRLMPGFGSRVAAALFLRPPRHATPARERRWRVGAVRGAIAGPAGPLSVWSWEPHGEGEMRQGERWRETGGSRRVPTVLLVHGWGGRGSQLGAFVAPLTAAGYRVVAFDGPGHGRTAATTGHRRSSLPEMVEGVLAVAGHLGPLHGVVAHSAGAGAVTYALRHGLETERLVYLAPAVEPSHFTASLRRWFGVPRPVLDRMRERLERRFGIPWSELRGATFAPERSEDLFIVHDRLDEEVPCWLSRDLVEAWPGSRLEVVSGLGHRRILRDPRVVESAVGFLTAARHDTRREAAA